MNQMTTKASGVGEGPVRMDLKPERVQELLAKLPGWALRAGGGALVRVRTFTTPLTAGSFARNACWLATKLEQPLTVSLASNVVTITLTGHPVRGCTGGLTGPVFKLADLIG
ncbi:MAG TPA: 4a-hydroxytetrahydrobiopterin dehydratase [Thermoanaerobaculia bacterium]|jgi:pterin-4a-carbinolamine dehydratase|nr:4a-hydroxytetrahydrobiopterin dehydratase [Thermoanaerobaculia bacterium]